MYKRIWELDDNTKLELRRSMLGNFRVFENSREISSFNNTLGFNKETEFEISDGRRCKIKTKSNGFTIDSILYVNNDIIFPNDVDVKKVCNKCQVENKLNDKFCSSCGLKLPDGVTVNRHMEVGKARSTIFWISIMFLAFGIFAFFVNKTGYDESLAKLYQMDPNQDFSQQINGQTYKVAEVIVQVQIEKYSLLAINSFLFIVMLLLSIWAKKAPLGALIVASAVYLSVQVMNAIIDPLTIGQGIIVKIIVITFLVKGIKSALEMRQMKGERVLSKL